MVLLNTTEFSNIELAIRAPMYLILFSWIALHFMKVTLTASKLIDICNGWRLLQMDVVKNCANMKPKRSEEFRYLLLFIKCSKLDLGFTGLGMFQLNRSLLLTMVSAVLSYSVLAVTF
ncbi:uncharacterized protein CDAR_451581 [Caerostris darwini]|uniref:Gustatory receptor n=1 Tax=Caerostris darwini TaxID=1538125 RepID=A0AAV4UJH6_9ARAC|nr:uncharacterized protein CDAR_451581 [Caerostris darwini]